MARDKYIYPAVFHYAEDGISVRFPDLPGCFTCGDSDEGALEMAKEALALHLYGMEEEGLPFPEPSKVHRIEVGPGEAVVLVEVWMPPFRDKVKQETVKKTLTIPKWLNDLAEERKVNFSQVLQTALKQYLGLGTEAARK